MLGRNKRSEMREQEGKRKSELSREERARERRGEEKAPAEETRCVAMSSTAGSHRVLAPIVHPHRDSTDHWCACVVGI